MSDLCLKEKSVSYDAFKELCMRLKTEKQLTDVFYKALDAPRFESLRKALGICTV